MTPRRKARRRGHASLTSPDAVSSGLASGMRNRRRQCEKPSPVAGSTSISWFPATATSGSSLSTGAMASPHASQRLPFPPA